jgi:hypothetical protein
MAPLAHSWDIGKGYTQFVVRSRQTLAIEAKIVDDR